MYLHLRSVSLLALLISVCICSDDEKEPWNRVELVAVSNFEHLDQFYLTLHVEQKSATHPTLEVTTHQKELSAVKEDICKYVFTSHYFDMVGVDWVKGDLKKTRSIIKDNKPIRFNDIFERSESSPKKWYSSSSSSKQTFDYVNPYKYRAVFIAGHYEYEHVFICLVRERETKKIKEYFVSEAYNVHEKPVGRYVTGRFIFELHGLNDLTIAALAEEPVRMFIQGTQSAELFYLDKKLHSSNFTAASATDESICRLTTGQRTRLCAAIFNSLQFKDSIKFFQTPNSVQGSCDKKKISFVFSDSLKLVGSKVFEEWMIPCRPTKFRSMKPTGIDLYYISRSYVKNRLFVFNVFEGNIYAEYYGFTSSIPLEE